MCIFFFFQILFYNETRYFRRCLVLEKIGFFFEEIIQLYPIPEDHDVFFFFLEMKYLVHYFQLIKSQNFFFNCPFFVSQKQDLRITPLKIQLWFNFQTLVQKGLNYRNENERKSKISQCHSVCNDFFLFNEKLGARMQKYLKIQN